MDEKYPGLKAFEGIANILDKKSSAAIAGTSVKLVKWKDRWVVAEIIYASLPRKKPVVTIIYGSTPDAESPALGPGIVVCPHCRGFLTFAEAKIENEGDMG